MSAKDDLIAELVAVLERFDTGRGHAAMVVTNEHLGVCNMRRHYVGGRRVKDGAGYRIADQTLDGTCAPFCLAFQRALSLGRAHVEATSLRQLDLEAAG